MAKFEKIYTKLVNMQWPIIALVAVVVGLIRYAVCRSFQCAFGWAMSGGLITLLAFLVFRVIGKRLLSSKTRGAEENIEKSDKEVEKVEK